MTSFIQNMRQFSLQNLYKFLAISFALPTYAEPIVIAHRGAPGYLPEHTLASKTLAYAMRPDFIEQDVVLSRDGHLLILHDHHLDQVTDVADKFPARARHDGRYYAIDFDLDEIKQLRVVERFNHETKERFFPQRFPQGASSFSVPTLEEEIELIQGLNQTLGYDVGIYVEIKNPQFHREEGVDISTKVLQTLKQYGYDSPASKAYVQCFDAEELKRIATRLMPELDMRLKLVQLIYQPLPKDFTQKDFDKMKQYADALGINSDRIVQKGLKPDQFKLTGFVEQAHRYGLDVHVYTLRADELPSYAQNFHDALHVLIKKAKVDGLFTDFPDQTRQFIFKSS